MKRQTLDIIGRSIASLIHTQGIGDLYRMYLQTERDGVDYNLAFIPPDFTAVHKEEFDTEFMRQLFDRSSSCDWEGHDRNTEAIARMVRCGLGVSVVPLPTGRETISTGLKWVSFGDPPLHRSLVVIERQANPQARLVSGR